MPQAATVDLPGPRNFWMKTHIFQQGHKLVAINYIAAAGSPEIFRVSVDLRPIARAVKLYHEELHRRAKVQGCVGCEEKIAGFFSSIGNVIKKVGRSKLLKQVSRTAKAVVKSKITGAIVLGTAAVFPPVGGPAVAAYAAANAALAAVEKGNALRKTITGALGIKRKTSRAVIRAKVNVKASAKMAARRRFRFFSSRRTAVATTRAQAMRTQRARAMHAQASRARIIERARARKRALASARTAARRAAQRASRRAAPSIRLAMARRRAAQRKLNYAAQHKGTIRRTMARSDSAKKYIKKIVATSKYSPNANKRFEASKAARIYNIVASHRRNLRSITQPQTPRPGLVVDAKGRITKGRYIQESASKGAALQIMLAAKGKVQPGYFRRISGCVGCG